MRYLHINQLQQGRVFSARAAERAGRPSSYCICRPFEKGATHRPFARTL